MDTDKQIAIKGAELLGYDLYGTDMPTDEDKIDRWISHVFFDPVNSANDMNKLIEALKIDVVFNSEWVACVDLGVDTVEHRSKSRDEAIRECVIKALGLHNDSEALGVDND